MKSSRIHRWHLLVTCLYFLPAFECSAGTGVTSGAEWHIWIKGEYSVIVASVIEAHALPSGRDGTHGASLQPLALIAGTLDPSEHPTIDVTFHAGGGGGTSIWGPPRAGSIVLAVMRGTNFIVSDNCPFMPDEQVTVDLGNTKITQVWKGSALVEIGGLGDPKVVETLKRIQEARAHPDPDPHGSPKARLTTQPTTRPSKPK